MTKLQLKVSKSVDVLSKRMLRENIGRRCEITIKSTGERLDVVRTGYGPMEYQERDSAELRRKNGEVIYKAKDLYDLSVFLIKNF